MKRIVFTLFLFFSFTVNGVTVPYRNLSKEKHFLKKIDEMYFILKLLPRELEHNVISLKNILEDLISDYLIKYDEALHGNKVLDCCKKIADLDENLAKLKKNLFSLEDLLRNKGCTVDLSLFERTVYSQNGEDGIIEILFEFIGHSSKYYVEFGVEDGKERNTRNLQENYRWTGLLMDGGYEDESINLKKEFITAENINELFEKYNVPEELDLLSIDIDYNDFHVWKALDEKYKPRVIVIGFNAFLIEDKVVKYSPNAFWDGSDYCGASIKAMYNLGRKKGYSLVYVENNGVNLFFVRDDILSLVEKNTSVTFKDVNDVEKLYKPPFHHKEADTLNREFVSSESLLS